MARPKKDIDEAQVLRLAMINCSYEEMAAVLDCDESTLTRRFAQVIRKGRSSGRMSLKRKQYEMAMKGHYGMLKWLGQQLLGQTIKQDVKETSEVTVHKSTERKQFIDEVKKQIEANANERKQSQNPS